MFLNTLEAKIEFQESQIPTQLNFLPTRVIEKQNGFLMPGLAAHHRTFSAKAISWQGKGSKGTPREQKFEPI